MHSLSTCGNILQSLEEEVRFPVQATKIRLPASKEEPSAGGASVVFDKIRKGGSRKTGRSEETSVEEFVVSDTVQSAQV
jgi:hypothetical protein